MHIIYADGIGTGVDGFQDGQSILRKVVDRLLFHKPSFKATRLRWPASMATVGGNHSWTEASKIGVDGINAIIDDEPEREYILLGYSGGCRVIHDWLEKNPHRLNKIAAVGLMSDPFRPKGKQQYGMSPTDGWGICGQRPGPIPHSTFWVSAPGDAITDAAPDSILRTPADVSDVMPGQFLGDLRHHIEKGDLQLAWQIGIFRHNPLGWFMGLGPRLHQARIDINGYLRGGRHTTAYVTPYDKGPSPADRLANSINWYIDHR